MSDYRTVTAHGATIPTIGLGTWTLKDEEGSKIVTEAIAAGYRHIDTARMYDNETAVGAGIKASKIARKDVFVTTKVWKDDIAGGDLQRSAETSLKRLGLDRVDLLSLNEAGELRLGNGNCPGSWAVKPGKQIQQCRFPATGFAQYGDVFACGDIERNAAQCMAGLPAAHGIRFVNIG